jgi:hypothetical protein
VELGVTLIFKIGIHGFFSSNSCALQHLLTFFTQENVLLLLVEFLLE